MFGILPLYTSRFIYEIYKIEYNVLVLVCIQVLATILSTPVHEVKCRKSSSSTRVHSVECIDGNLRYIYTYIPYASRFRYATSSSTGSCIEYNSTRKFHSTLDTAS
jgi:hypothetical protein